MQAESASLARFIETHSRISVLAGAGVSTASGIPDYRDRDGEWKHARPVEYREFMGQTSARARYWARSYSGWQRIAHARPNPAHRALAGLEAAGRMDMLITQNVDGLHQSAGSRRVIDLHGKLATVSCTSCGTPTTRADWQHVLTACNPDWQSGMAAFGPDGDALIDGAHIESFLVPACRRCGGIVKPDVVFFGEPVPKARVVAAAAAVERSDALLVVGSSLMVYSGFRFVRMAADRCKPVAIVNQGRTRGDALATLKLDGDCALVLPSAVSALVT